MLTGLLKARDTELMVGALSQLGVGFDELAPAADGSPRLRVRPPAVFTPAPAGIDCGLAGTVMRFVPPLAALAVGRTSFYGDEHASQRPMGPVLDGLSQLGVQVDARQLPFTMTAPTRLGGPVVQIDASASSQFISALLLVAARYPHGIELRHVGASVPSLPHIEMTIEMLGCRGVQVDQPDATSWRIQPGLVAGRDHRIEPDLTNAAVFLAAGVLSGGQVTVPGWPRRTTQPGALFTKVLTAMGAEVELNAGQLVARAPSGLHGAKIDLHQASELTPVVAALAVFAAGTTSIGGVAHIRGHETDRLAAIEAELTSLGVRVQQSADGLLIAGVADGNLRPSRVLKSYADHRMAHLAALIGLRTAAVQLDDIGAVAKTMPDFEARWQAMLAQVVPQ